jgi:hypothetical protein
MDQLINSLPALLQVAGDTEEIRKTAAAVAWDHVAGEALRLQTATLGLEQQRLSIAVSDAIWKRQLESMSGQLLFRLNSLLGHGVVKFIDFQVDPGAVQTAAEKRAAVQYRRAKPERELPVPFELVTAAATIHNSKLRKAFIGAAMSCARRLERDSKT